jgi:hypothetical protein
VQNWHLYQCHIDFHAILPILFIFISFFQCRNVEAVGMQEIAPLSATTEEDAAARACSGRQCLQFSECTNLVLVQVFVTFRMHKFGGM